MTQAEVEQKVRTALDGIIGTYKVGGRTLPAYFVVPPSAPSGVVCSGLEAILRRDPEISKVVGLTDAKLISAYWILTLIQWDDTASTYSACRRLLTVFDSIGFETTRKTDLTNAQTIVKIFDPAWA
jgi:hypothetical protein